MKTERQWTGHGFREVTVPDEDDFAAALARIPEPTPEERLQAARRYLMARYGGILPYPSAGTRCPGCGVPDETPADSSPLPDTDEQARSYCTTCGRRID